MKLKYIFWISIILLAYNYPCFAQNPFNELGYKPKVLTLSNGKYEEKTHNDSIIHIGSVYFNILTKKVVSFIPKDTLYSESTGKPEIVSRWIAPDPLATKYPEVSPYNYVMNNPLIYIDPDGKDWFYYQQKGEEKKQWHFHEGNVAKYIDVNGKSQTSNKGYAYLVTYAEYRVNSQGASVGRLVVFNQLKPELIVDNAFSGSSDSKAQRIEKGNYMMRLGLRDAIGPTKMNEQNKNPETTYGIQKIYDKDIKGSDGKLYLVSAAYGNGRIRLLEVDNNLKILTPQNNGYFLHGKKDSWNWTHGCVCDKSEQVFNYFWNGAGKAIRSNVPFVVLK